MVIQISAVLLAAHVDKYSVSRMRDCFMNSFLLQDFLRYTPNCSCNEPLIVQAFHVVMACDYNIVWFKGVRQGVLRLSIVLSCIEGGEGRDRRGRYLPNT